MRLLVAAAFLTMPLAGLAQGPAYMVKDIKTESPTIDIPWPRPYEQQEWNGLIYFGTEDGVHGNEVWRWSPSSGAELLADICPGECSASPYEFTPHGAYLYFTAVDADHGRELWRTDGTRDGTHLVVDLSPGVQGAAPSFLTGGPGGRLYFAAGRTEYEDRELWASDGSAAGTYQIADIAPGTPGSNPLSIVEHHGALFFVADDGTHGLELWTSDGTGPGTTLVEDFCPGATDCFWPEGWYWMGRRQLASAENGLLLVAGEHTQTLALLSDGTGSIEDLAIEPQVFNGFLELDGAKVFDACGAQWVCNVWRSDGTPGGTYALSNIASGFLVDVFGTAGGWAYFVVQSEGNLELWRSHDSAGGAEPVAILGSASDWEAGSVQNGVAVGERLFFAASAGSVGKEPWVTDGTAEGTFLLADVFPGELGSFSAWLPQKLAAVDGRVAFFAAHPDIDFPLWSSDLTVAGTALVADIDRQVSSMPTSFRHGSDLRGGPLGGRLLFGADHPATGVELWATDGTEQGTSLLADLEPGESTGGFPWSSDPQAVLADSGVAIIASYSGLWATDGTTTGTVELVEDDNGLELFARPGVVPSPSPEVYVAGGSLVVTDGTPGGTVSLETNVGEDRPVTLRGSIFVGSYQASTGYELWSTPGGPGEAALLRDIYPGSESSHPDLLAGLGNVVLLSADDGVSGRELWRSDGSEAGTLLLLDINPDGDGDPRVPDLDHEPAVLSGRLFFSADDGAHGRELWASDGTTSGTAMEIDINPGALPSDPSEIVVAGSSAFFFANDGRHGRELWMADGFSQPRLVKDIHHGPPSAVPVLRIGRRMLPVGDRVYFSASDGKNGLELWASDGTEQGTRLLQDINPGPGSSSPSNFVVAGSCLYFSATDGEHGFELWALPLAPSLDPGPPDCEPAPRKARQLTLRADHH